jgi:hypothetical protein
MDPVEKSQLMQFPQFDINGLSLVICQLPIGPTARRRLYKIGFLLLTRLCVKFIFEWLNE